MEKTNNKKELKTMYNRIISNIKTIVNKSGGRIVSINETSDKLVVIARMPEYDGTVKFTMPSSGGKITIYANKKTFII